jgi:hypothetical protein
VAVVLGAALLAGVTHHAGGQGDHARKVVETSADRLTYRQASDALAQMRVGDFSPLHAIVDGVPLQYRAARAEGDAVILTFASREGACVDLVARPAANTVKTSNGC